MKILLFFLLFFIVFFGLTAYSQNYAHIKTKTIHQDSCSITLDSLYILPSSIVVTNVQSGEQILPSFYTFNFQSSFLTLNDSLCNTNNSYAVRFKTFNIPLNLTIQHKDSAIYGANIDSTKPLYQTELTSFNPYLNDKLIKEGNISRGIAVGNSQGASLQSSLDVRLSGKLNDDIEILALITDNNIPIQPEGNTQQLQEFDQVFVELKKNKTGLRVGDINLNKPEGYFLNYNKKTQGGSFYTSFDSDNSLLSSDSCSQSIRLSGGISKGKFNRNTFTGINGNQGPYRLTGSLNELFIVVLAGTEKVYINGDLMERGQNFDYVIDYNTAEVSFTPERMITTDSRIVIEFEYSDKNYVRSLFTGSYAYSDKITDFRLHFFSEQDARNQPLQQNLDADNVFTLQQAGDNPLAATIPGWDSLTFSSDYVLYALIDSLGYDSIFLYSVDPTIAHYKVNFSFVGIGQGNYVIDSAPANGRVFKWVAPNSGILQGDYEPYVILIAPQKQQMLVAAMDFNISEKSKTGFELAVSNQDLNTFSSLNNNNNIGTAARFYLSHTSFFKSDSSLNKLSLLKEISYEFVEARFVPVDRFRPVEFDREWNISPNENRSNDHIISGSLILKNQKTNLISYKSDYFVRSTSMNGFKNSLNFNLTKGVFHFENKLVYLNSDRKSFYTDFFRQKGNVSVKLGSIMIGSLFEHEINLFTLKNDSLLGNSYTFFEYEPFIQTAKDSTKIIFRSWYKHRDTKGTGFGVMKKILVSDEFGTKVTSNISTFNRLSVTAIYRSTTVKDTALIQLKNDNTIISRIEHSMNLGNNGITSFMFYEIGSGLESKKNYSYLEVTQGQGQYKWIDYNQNGIKELSEFETANYQDEANFIRIVMPSNEYIRAYTMLFNETFVLEPSRIWRNDTVVWKKILSRFSNRFQYSVGQKTTSELFENRFIPFKVNFQDSSIISINSGLSNTFFFNRAHPVFNVRYRYSDNTNKSLLINGFEVRRSRINELFVVWNLSKSMGIESEFRIGTMENTSDLSLAKNYNLSISEISPKFNIQPSVKKRYSLIARYYTSENILSVNNEKSTILSLGPDFRFPVNDKHSFTLRLTYHQITFSGITNSPLAYEMLESLEPGKNLTWNVMVQYIVSKSLVLNFMYEGRQSEGKKSIHFGSIQLKAML